MSANSFPRPEHVAALLAHARKLADLQSDGISVSDAGLDRFRCQYRLELKNQATGWIELVGVHFQLAEKLLGSGSAGNLDRKLLAGLHKCLFGA